MKKKIIPVIVALALILIIALIGFGGMILDKYSYSKELANLDEYFGVAQGELAIILQDEMVEEKALLRDEAVYFDIDTMKKYLNEGFYVDLGEQKLLYTTADDTVATVFGGREYADKGGSHPTEYATCLLEGEQLYVAAEYVRLFTNFSYERFDRHIQMYTQWGEKQMLEVTKNTQVRTLGGIKSPILRELEEGEMVELLNQMETWSEVKTSDSLIGYVENKRLGNESTEVEVPVTDYVPAEYTSLSREFLIGAVSHTGKRVKQTVGIVRHVSQGVRVFQCGHVHIFALGHQPCAEVDEAVIRAAVLHDGGSGPQAVLIGQASVSGGDVIKLFRLLRPQVHQPFHQPLAGTARMLLRLGNQRPEGVLVDLGDTVAHLASPPRFGWCWVRLGILSISSLVRTETLLSV